ncbi:hypothetical protein B0T11DRAFT_273739, partial [Plectosphaerella cucumerina]
MLSRPTGPPPRQSGRPRHSGPSSNRPWPVIDLARSPRGVFWQSVLIPNFWPRSLCNSHVAHMSGLRLATTPAKPNGDAVRVNNRFQVYEPRFASRLWLETSLHEVLTQD